MRQSLIVVVSLLAVSGCGGSPSPSPVGPSNAPLTISPLSVTMSTGSSQLFTASGSDGFNYVWSDVTPISCFASEILSVRQIRVTMLCRPNLASVQVIVEAPDCSGRSCSGIARVIATITLN